MHATQVHVYAEHVMCWALPEVFFGALMGCVYALMGAACARACLGVSPLWLCHAGR